MGLRKILPANPIFQKTKFLPNKNVFEYNSIRVNSNLLQRSYITPLMKITVYTPESAIRSPRKLIKEMFFDLKRSHDLAWRLSVRDISAQYRQSKLGILWAFIMPLATTVTWIFLNMAGIITIKSTDIPYPIYVFTGTLIWSILIESLYAPLAQTNAAESII